tara:strand:- start:947 stop:1063 length:117 start_codon:yes stop_codon:yes gene_type:complete
MLFTTLGAFKTFFTMLVVEKVPTPEYIPFVTTEKLFNL